MGKSKYPEKLTIEWVFDVNSHPTKFDIECNERRWRYIMDILFKPISEETKKKLKDLSEHPTESSHDPPRSTIITKTSLRCTECGAIWSAKYLPDGTYAPDCFNCPNGCREKKGNSCLVPSKA